MGALNSKSCCIPSGCKSDWNIVDCEDETSDNKIQKVHIYDLPNEILFNIFQHLDLSEKLRSEEAFEGHENVQNCLWQIFKLEVKAVSKKDTFDYIDRPVSFTDLLKVLQISGQYLKTLSFDLNPPSSKKSKVIINDIGKLLDFWDRDTFLQCAIENCKNLKFLELRMAFPIRMNFSTLIEVNENLESILFHVENLMSHDYIQLSKTVESFPKLRKNLSVYRVTEHGEEFFPEIHYDAFEIEKIHAVVLLNQNKSVIQKLLPHNLSVLRLKPSWNNNISWTLRDMKTIAQLKHLVELDLNKVGVLITNRVMIAILNGCTKLEKISLSYLRGISAELMNTIMTASASLKTVELKEVGMHSLLLDGATSKVESLSIKNCLFYAKGGIRKISKFPNLKKLNLNNEDKSENSQYSNKSLSAISKSCWQLEEVSVDVSSPDLTSGLALFANLPNLRSCYFSGTYITEIYPKSTILSVLPLSNMRTLHLFHCSQLSESSLIQAVSHMPHLKAFFIEIFNKSMTDKVIEKLVSYCRKLDTLYLIGCSGVTASGILSLKDCHSLMNLSLMFLEIQPFSICDLVKPNLKCLRFRYLPQVPEYFVRKSITEEMRKSMFTLMYDGKRLI